jgi:hypothetical protein
MSASEDHDAQVVAAALVGEPVDLNAAMAPEREGGLPAKAGFYAWWSERDAIAGVPHHPHPAQADLGLLYVGISPTRQNSSGLIRSRVIDQHIRGNTSSSTFRFVLASLLIDELALNPQATAKKVVLDTKVELRRVVGLTVFGQVEAELPKLGALVGEKAVERVVEHCRYQLPHDQNSMVSGRLGTVLARGTCLSRAAALAWPRRLWPVASASDATAARKSSVPGRLAGCAVRYRTRPTAIEDLDLPVPRSVETRHSHDHLGTVRLPRRPGRARRPRQGQMQHPALRRDLVVATAPANTVTPRPQR